MTVMIGLRKAIPVLGLSILAALLFEEPMELFRQKMRPVVVLGWALVVMGFALVTF